MDLTDEADREDSAPLAPRRVDSAPPARQRGKRWPAIAVLVVVLVGGGVVVTKFLTSAIDYFCNVDEVNAKDGCGTGDRFRVQGVVVEGSLAESDAGATFALEYNGVELPVRYARAGSPGGLFQECIPVVVHGKLEDDGTFVGDSVEVKHSNEYEAANEDRLGEAGAESAACQQQT